MIVKDIATIRKHLDVNSSFEYKSIESYLESAEMDFLKPVISLAQLQVFEVAIVETQTELTRAKHLVESAICHYAYYLWSPVGAIQMTSAGFVVSQNPDAKAASIIEKNELMRALKSMAHKRLDNLLEHMEISPDIFTQFFASDQYKEYSSLLVNKTSVFNKYFNINNSYQTYLKLQSELRIVEDQFIVPAIQESLLTALKTAQTNENRQKVKILLQKACVGFTIAKVMENGAFKFNGDSIVMRFDVLPYEQLKTVENNFISGTKKNKMSEANNYLRMALEKIRANPTEFPEYILPDETTKQEMIVKVGGMVGF